MKMTRTIQRNVSAAAAICVAAVALSGCELLVDFDRSKIPPDDGGSALDATVADSSSTDEAAQESAADGTAANDALGDDASLDATVDMGDADASSSADGGASSEATADGGAADAPAGPDMSDAFDALGNDAADGDDGG